MIEYTHALKFSITFLLKTPLLLRSGFAGDFADSTIEKTPDRKELHINGYVWASLLRRAMARVEQYKDIASEIGNYEKPEEKGVSPFWFESSFVPLLKVLDMRPGIKIDRQYGTQSKGALYNDEIVPPGYEIKLNFICFHPGDKKEEMKKAVGAALGVINEGIENIGGGWSYGYGRLKSKQEEAFAKNIDLADKNQRANLWKEETYDNNEDKIDIKEPENKSWIKYAVEAKISTGQLLAVHSDYFKHVSEKLPQEIEDMEHLPDTFVFRRYIKNNNEIQTEFSIPGKAIRQALLSTQIERKLRTHDNVVCGDITKSKKLKEDCTCKRCKWFGNTNHSGIIAVSDAVIEGAESVILHRVQLCEHSMQNIQFFSGEYLKKGGFSFDIWIDYSRNKRDAAEMENEIRLLLAEMENKEENKEENKDKKAPPGWYRLGATSTCTGQIEVIDYEPKE